VSVCGSEQAVVDYFAAHADCGYDADFLATLVMVEVTGSLSDEEDEDAAEGALLIIPTKVLSVRPLADDEIAAICG
jgi:hypothetical protein